MLVGADSPLSTRTGKEDEGVPGAESKAAEEVICKNLGPFISYFCSLTPNLVNTQMHLKKKILSIDC